MSTPLRDLLNGILFDPSTRAGFATDPGSFLQQHGWGELDAQDVHTALTALVDDLPLERAVVVAPAVEAAAPEHLGSVDIALEGAIDGLVAATAVVHADPGAAEMQLEDTALVDIVRHNGELELDADLLDDTALDDDTALNDTGFGDTVVGDTVVGDGVEEIDDFDLIDEPGALDTTTFDDDPFDASFDTSFDNTALDGTSVSQDADEAGMGDDVDFGID